MSTTRAIALYEPLSVDLVLEEIMRTAKQWREPYMERHLDGARIFAVNLLTSGNRTHDEAERLVDAAIAEGKEAGEKMEAGTLLASATTSPKARA